MVQRIGFIGAGLMGHGMARNIVEKGYELSVLAHRNRAPIEDLLGRGASEAESPASLARASDVVILCVPSSAEVELCVFAENGLMAGAHGRLDRGRLHHRRACFDRARGPGARGQERALRRCALDPLA